MRNKLNKLRNEIMNKLEGLLEKSPNQAIALIPEDKDVELPSFEIEKHSLITRYSIKSISLDENGEIDFNGAEEESGDTYTEESDWIPIETLVSILELAEQTAQV